MSFYTNKIPQPSYGWFRTSSLPPLWVSEVVRGGARQWKPEVPELVLGQSCAGQGGDLIGSLGAVSKISQFSDIVNRGNVMAWCRYFFCYQSSLALKSGEREQNCRERDADQAPAKSTLDKSDRQYKLSAYHTWNCGIWTHDPWDGNQVQNMKPVHTG